MSKITEIRSGGQSGADRGAMDAARAFGTPLSGWCPAGGWAEDFPTAPGVLALYPEMVETPSSNVIQRTEWNIRDSTCCLVFNTKAEGTSPGTDVGFVFNERYGIPHREFALDDPDSYDAQVTAAVDWLNDMNDDAIVLGVGGPRESEYPGMHDIAFDIVTSILAALNQ